MGHYPNLQPALPTSFVKPNRTSRILQPGIVLATVVILGCVSLVALIVAASAFQSESPRTSGVNTTQAFALSASFLSITYLIFHAFAATYNEPVGVVRPPELKLHAACFILARMLVVFWFSTFIAAMVTLSKPNICMKGSRDCQLQVADVVSSIVALIATGIILTALEACKYPFQLPDFFHITKRITVRVSSFAEDFLDRSVSRASSFDNDNLFETKKIDVVNQKSGTNRKPDAESLSNDSQASIERPLTPLLQIHMPRRTKSRGWGEEWTHLAGERSLGSQKSLEKPSQKKPLPHSDSGISLSYDSSSGYLSFSESEHVSGSRCSAHKTSNHRSSDITPGATVARRFPHPRIVTPSSSISNSSRRSPLSTMRNAEYPDVVVRPDLRYCPPMIPPPHEWNSSRTASMSQLIPVADIRGWQRTSSLKFPDQLNNREPGKILPSLPRASTPPLMRRKTSDIRVPGAFVEGRLSLDQEANLDEHLRKIEVAHVTRRQSNKALQSDSPLRHRPSIQSHRSMQHRVSMRSPSMPQCRSSIQSDRSIHHKASAQGKYPLHHSLSVHSDHSLQHKTSMHSNRSSRGRRSSVQLPAVDETKKRSPSIRVDSKLRYRGQKPFVRRPSTSSGAKQVRPATAHVVESTRDEAKKEFHFRQLSLGDLTPGLGDVEKMFE